MPSDKSPPSTEWFRDWFNEDYTLVYGHRSDREAEEFVARWPIWREPLPANWCLDLGCGAGRFARSVAQRGLKTVGLDLSRALLRQAYSTPIVGDSPYYLRADIRKPPLKGKFGLVVSLFTSFGYFETDQEHSELLRTIGELLVPGGMLILDLPNRDAVLELEHVNVASARERKVGGTRIVESWGLDAGRHRVEKTIAVGEGTAVRHYSESVRLFSADELLGMTVAAGFTALWNFWGDYQGGPRERTSSRMIYFGRKRG